MANSLLINIDTRGVATITLNRPEKRNAFDDHLIKELTRQLILLEEDAAVRIVVLTGSENTFSSGADLNWMKSMVDYDMEANLKDSRALSDLMQQLYLLNKPTVAKVNGPAFGGAIGLIACCDYAVAVSSANFCFSEVKLGIAPAVITPYIVKALGMRQSKRLFLTGEVFNAQQALEWGLVHECVEQTELESNTEKVVKYLLKGGPKAQSEIKSFLQQDSPIDHLMQVESIKLIAKLRVSREGQEGISAFLDKRAPTWSKK